MVTSPFTWGAAGQHLSPSQVKKYSDVAAALAEKSAAPTTLGAGLSRVGDALLHNAYEARAADGEAEGAASRKAVLDALMSNPDPSMTDLAGAMGNQWVANDPGSQAVVQALMGQESQQQQRGFQLEDRNANWAHQDQLTADERAYDAPLREQQLQAGQQQLDMGPLDADYKRAQIDALNAKPAVTPTDDQREYELAKSQGFPGTFLDFKAAQRSNSGLSIKTNPDGTTEIIQGDLSGMPKLTEGQSKDIGFLTRGTGANAILANLDSELTSLGGNVAGAVPGGNAVQSAGYQQAKQAGDEFLAALLRKDSGGAITPDENKGYGDIYLPRFGDKPEVIEQKRAARARALAAIKLGLPPASILSLETQGIDLSGVNPEVAQPAAQSQANPDVVDFSDYFK